MVKVGAPSFLVTRLTIFATVHAWQWENVNADRINRRSGSPRAIRPRTAAHPFYKHQSDLDQAGFDAHVEKLCEPFYAKCMGRPSLALGRYFRLLLIGYFEELDSERAIAWRRADSFGVEHTLGGQVGSF